VYNDCMKVLIMYACFCSMILSCFVFMPGLLNVLFFIWTAPGKIHCKLTGLPSVNDVCLYWIESKTISKI